MSLFAYTCTVLHNGVPASTLVIFSGKGGLSANAIETAITDETDRSLSPEMVFIIIPEVSEDVRNEISDISLYHSISETACIGIYEYDSYGSVTLKNTLRNEERLPQELPLETLRRQGMTILFRRRNGLVEAGPTAHFVKPSGSKDSQFLLGAHALSDSAEIYFVAFWILKHISTYDIAYIQVDTSGIASVGLALSLLRKDFNPVIRTFESYDGLDKFDEQYDRDDLYLISASQSGSLLEKIKDKVKNQNLIITLFSLSPNNNSCGSILCDLQYDSIDNVQGYKLSNNHIDEKATSAINLVGERFMAEVCKPRKILPFKKDSPDVVVKYLENLVGKKVFRVFKTGLGGEVRAVWIDVKSLIKTTAFKTWISEVVSSQIPIATKGIVTFSNDPDSNLLYRAIISEVKKQGASLDCAAKLTLNNIQEANALANWPDKSSAVLIVGGVTGHGAELLSASRALRTFAEKSHRVYITAAAVPSSESSFKILNSNLIFPKHHFGSMFQLIIDRVEMISSWKEELAELKRNDLPESLQQRFNELNDSSVGLEHNLFLPSPNGPLFLRKNFAFWTKELSLKANQADVFTTIAVIIENLRSSDKIALDRRLTNTPYSRSVITAETFARYNDGVIQASILRAAKAVELNYKDSDGDSRLMADLILDMARLAKQPQGEALSEFLLALKLKRLLLNDGDYQRVINELHTNELDEIQSWWFNRLRSSDVVNIESAMGLL